MLAYVGIIYDILNKADAKEFGTANSWKRKCWIDKMIIFFMSKTVSSIIPLLYSSRDK